MQKVLQKIWHPASHKNRFLRGQIYYLATIFQSIGHPIVCRWTPSYFDLEKNKKANLKAKNKAEKSGKQAERWSLLAYIKGNLAQARYIELIKWHEVKTKDKEISRHCFYISWTKTKINPILQNAPKKYISQYYQLKVGYAAVGTYLTKIRMIKTSECW